MMKTIIIRGTKFEITNKTLQKMSYFTNDDNDLHLDRCPITFGYIIDFLVYKRFFHHDDLRKSGFSLTDVKILEDSIFYGVPGVADYYFNRGCLINEKFISIRWIPDYKLPNELYWLMSVSLAGENEIFFEFVREIIGRGCNNRMDYSMINIPHLVKYIVGKENLCMWTYISEHHDVDVGFCPRMKRNCLIKNGVNPCAISCSNTCNSE